MSDTIRQNLPLANVTPVQAIVAAALLSGKNQTEAALAAGIDRHTIDNWFKKDANFRAEFARIRQQLAEAMHERLQELETLALDNIRQILKDPKASPSVRLKASLAVLNRPSDPLKAWSVPIIPYPSVQVEEEIGGMTESVYEMKRPEIARNAPCPCGSGEKYKRCCGKDAPPMLAA